MDNNPLVQFKEWFEEAQKLPIKEPTFVTLATANAQGAPAARTVLLKAYDDRGFVFYLCYLNCWTLIVGCSLLVC